ncbi:MAG: hypothetical protein KA310_03205 [Pseudomonadales bacterium]|nr:hypothetical protein [Pseudomonadales bacterium]
MTSKALDGQKVAHIFLFHVTGPRLNRQVGIPAYELSSAVKLLRAWLADEGHEEIGVKWTRLKQKESNP